MSTLFIYKLSLGFSLVLGMARGNLPTPLFGVDPPHRCGLSSSSASRQDTERAQVIKSAGRNGSLLKCDGHVARRWRRQLQLPFTPREASRTSHRMHSSGGAKLFRI